MLELGEAGAVLEQLGAEVGEALLALFGLFGLQLVVDVALVVVKGAGEGGQRGGQLALEANRGG